MPTKIGNRSRRLAAKIRDLLATAKDRESQIGAILANDELSAEQKDAVVGRVRESIKANRSQANRLESRKQELAYSDTKGAAPTPTPERFLSHAEVLTDSREHPTRWARLSRRQCKCARAFFAVQEAYGAR